MAAPLRVHGTAVVLDALDPWSDVAGPFGVLFLGDSGSGKSTAALQLIEAGAKLVADDQVLLSRIGGRIIMTAPPSIAGRIEIRGAGIVRAPAAAEAPLSLAIICAAPVERMPGPAWFEPFAGSAVPRLALDPFAAGFVARVKAVLAAGGRCD